MRLIGRTAAVLSTMMALASASAPAAVSLGVEAAGAQGSTVSYSGGGVVTFDALAPGYIAPYTTRVGGIAVSFDGLIASPANSYGGAGGTPFVTVYNAVVTLSQAVTYFGLWGSALDSANSVDLHAGSTPLGGINLNGQGLGAAYKGNPNAAFLNEDPNEIFAFFNLFSDTPFDTVYLTWFGGGGFEIDNVTVGNAEAPVPEPASWATMVGGFALAGACIRQRRRRIAWRDIEARNA